MLDSNLIDLLKVLFHQHLIGLAIFFLKKYDLVLLFLPDVEEEELLEVDSSDFTDCILVSIVFGVLIFCSDYLIGAYEFDKSQGTFSKWTIIKRSFPRP